MADPDNWPHVWWVTNPRFGRSIDAKEQDLLLAVSHGFMTGDLRPFRAYLELGYPLDAPLREELIAAIEGRGGGGRFTLELIKKGQPGRGTLIDERQKVRRDYEIWDFVRRRRQDVNLKTAIDDAIEKFGLQRAAIMKARRDCQLRLEESSKQNAK